MASLAARIDTRTDGTATERVQGYRSRAGNQGPQHMNDTRDMIEQRQRAWRAMNAAAERQDQLAFDRAFIEWRTAAELERLRERSDA